MENDYSAFVSNVKDRFGIDLTSYKEAQMKRRLISLRNKHGYQNFHRYFSAINQDEVLLKEFLERLTINVSEFYRNPKRWDVLRAFILPQLINHNSNKKLVIWSAACSTGEEPYSLALMMKVYFPDTDFSILATDIDEGILEKARQGVFLKQSLKALPDNMKDKFFKYEQSKFYIDNELKRHITFKKHDLLADSYPVNIDLIVCRNVLIYFTNQAKAAIYNKFSNSLKQNGVLFVGSTEQIFYPYQYNLSLIDTFFYQKNSHP